jgi:hypothetical protein
MTKLTTSTECEQYLNRVIILDSLIKGNFQNDKTYCCEKLKDFKVLQKRALENAVIAAQSTDDLISCALTIEKIDFCNEMDVVDLIISVVSKTQYLELSLQEYLCAWGNQIIHSYSNREKPIDPETIIIDISVDDESDRGFHYGR